MSDKYESAKDFADEWGQWADYRWQLAELQPTDERHKQSAEIWERMAELALGARGISPLVLDAYKRNAEHNITGAKVRKSHVEVSESVGFGYVPTTPNSLLEKILNAAGFDLPQLVAPSPRGSPPPR